MLVNQNKREALSEKNKIEIKKYLRCQFYTDMHDIF